MSKTRKKLALLSTLVFAATVNFASAETAPAFKVSNNQKGQRVGATATADEKMRSLSGDKFDLFFSGEFAAKNMSFFALPDDAAGAARLVLTMQTAISAAPEQSTMRIFVNGNDVGTAQLVSGDKYRIDLALPTGVVQPGYNSVAFIVQQKHRVDCSIEATYELWTQIEPESSGFIFAHPSASSPSFVDLLTVSGLKNGRTPIKGLVLEGASMSEMDQEMSVIQALTILGNFDHPYIEFGKEPGAGPGIDVIVGTPGVIKGLTQKDPKWSNIGRKIAVDIDPKTQRRTLMVSGDSQEQILANVRDLVALASTDKPVGTAQGLRALENQKGKLMTPGTRVSLSELGFVAQPFAGRRLVSSVNFSMPSDFYPGDYANMIFHVNALYAAGLAKNAVLTVKANDKIVANIPLSSSKAGAIEDQRLPIPLSVLRPGQNTLQIEARVPSRSDAVCETVEGASSSFRIHVQDNSYLEVPEYARIGRYPDIAALTSGSNPGSGKRGNDFTYLFVPNLEKNGLNSAATFVAKMAYSSGKVMPVRFTSVLPELTSNNMIAFGSFDSLPADLSSKMKLDFVSMPVDRPSGTLDLISGEMATEGGAKSDIGFFNEGFGQDSQPGEPSLSPADERGIAAYLRDVVDSPVDHVQALGGMAKSWAFSTLRELGVTLMPKLLSGQTDSLFSPSLDASIVLAQNGNQQGGIWTIVASRTSAALLPQTDILTNRSVWNKLGGSVLTVSDTGDIIDQHFSEDEVLFPTQPLTLANVRLIAAGWLARHVEIYVAALLAAALLLGMSTFVILRMGRPNND